MDRPGSERLVNVVLVGLGLAGAGAANALGSSLPASHRLICISATEAAYYPISSLRGSVVEPWDTKTTLPLDSFFPTGSRHVVVAGTTVIALGKDSVTVDKAHPELGLDTTIPFEYAVLATGSAYPRPCRPPPTESSIPQVTHYLRELQSGIAAAKSLLVIGGGPVGIELAGEVKAQYKDKDVTLVHSGNRFLPDFKQSLGESLKSQLEAMGVQLVFGTRLATGELATGPIPSQSFDLGAGRTVEADYLFVAYGNKPQTSLVKALDPSLVDADDRVIVKPSFQIDTPDGSLDKIFAIGDISNVAETKLWAHAQNHGAIVGANIAQLIKGKSAGLKAYAPGAKLIVVSVGPNGGAGQIYMGVVVGAWATALAKSRGLFWSKFQALYHG